MSYDQVSFPTSEQIQINHDPSNGLCILCAKHEDASHIFFNCKHTLLEGVRQMLLSCNWNPSIIGEFVGVIQWLSGYSIFNEDTSVRDFLGTDSLSSAFNLPMSIQARDEVNSMQVETASTVPVRCCQKIGDVLGDRPSFPDGS